jgi:hypothetical protein
MPICTFCKRSLFDKATLNKHQRTSKYCVKIQLETDPTKAIENEIYECEFCNRHLSAKCALKKHLLICKAKKKKDDEIDIKTEVLNLKKELQQLKKCPPTTINVTDNSTKSITDNSTKTINNYSSILDYNLEMVTEKFKKHYTINNLLSGNQRQLADMTVQHLLSGKEQPMYYVADRSRNKFMYTDTENNEKEDANACILRSLVYRGIRPVIKNIYHKEFKRLRAELAKYQRIDIDSSIANMHLELRELEESYKKMDIINESGDYISQLSKCLPTSILDRIYQDNLINQSIVFDPQYDSDEEFKQQLEKEVRMIGDHCVVELQKYKDLYQKTGETFGPLSITRNPKYHQEYSDFLQGKD